MDRRYLESCPGVRQGQRRLQVLLRRAIPGGVVGRRRVSRHTRPVRQLMDEFIRNLQKDVSDELLEWFDGLTLRELTLLHLKCKHRDKNQDREYLADVERIRHFLNNEINRRLQKRTFWLAVVSIVVSVLALAVSVATALAGGS